MSEDYTEEGFDALKESINDAIRYTHDRYLDDDEVIQVLESLSRRGFRVVSNNDEQNEHDEPELVVNRPAPDTVSFKIYKIVGAIVILEIVNIPTTLCDLEIDTALGYIVGYCEGVLSKLHPHETMDVTVSNYPTLSETMQSRARQLLERLSVWTDGSRISENTNLRIKSKWIKSEEYPGLSIYLLR